MRSYVELAARVPGWTRGVAADELAIACRSLTGEAVIVEIGAFMGSATVVLGGSRRLAGRGMVHSIDPFDGSGDEFSTPVYSEMVEDVGVTQRERFDRSIAEADVADRVTVHTGTAQSVIGSWSTPIDLLLLDGDQSPAGARSAFDLWEPWLHTGGVIAITNSAPRSFAPDHDGQFLVADRLVVAPRFRDRRIVGSWTFAVKAAAGPTGV